MTSARLAWSFEAQAVATIQSGATHPPTWIRTEVVKGIAPHLLRSRWKTRDHPLSSGRHSDRHPARDHRPGRLVGRGVQSSGMRRCGRGTPASAIAVSRPNEASAGSACAGRWASVSAVTHRGPIEAGPLVRKRHRTCCFPGHSKLAHVCQRAEVQAALREGMTRASGEDRALRVVSRTSTSPNVLQASGWHRPCHPLSRPAEGSAPLPAPAP